MTEMRGVPEYCFAGHWEDDLSLVLYRDPRAGKGPIEPRRASTTPTTTSSPEVVSATLIVHVYEAFGPATEADEGAPLHISR